MTDRDRKTFLRIESMYDVGSCHYNCTFRWFCLFIALDELNQSDAVVRRRVKHTSAAELADIYSTSHLFQCTEIQL